MTDEATLWIAVYGAFLSTAMLLWNIYLKHSDKPKLKVTTSPGFISQGSETSETQIFLTASNIGKRPVTLASCGIDLDNEEEIIFIGNDKFPRRLEEGQSHTVFRSFDSLKQQLSSKKPVNAWFKDETGKKHSSKWHLKNFL